ncbi:MAG TPA: hypothetical protein VEL51_18325 [Vicinamibacterales bacterium]|nr:hypothetical protein [Vicinamibacterales bacterium]
MKKTFFSTFASVLMLAASASAQQFSNVSPTATTNVKAADDFATRAFQDPWDMSQRTDLGWWTFGTDTAIGANFVNPTYANGIFTGSMNGSTTAELFLLESGLQKIPGVGAAPVGKTGQQYPIDANYFTRLVYRMNSTVAGVSQYDWSRETIYDDQTLGVEVAQSATSVVTGWKIYDVNLPNLTPVQAVGTPSAWGGTIRALQFLPNAASNSAQIQLDWVRLVHDDDLTLHQKITWTGSAADIYLDNDTDPANGTLGRIGVNKTSPFDFFVGGLPAGSYFVAVHAHTDGEATLSGFTYSTGSYVVNDIPTLQFTTPSDEGSTEDFATVRLGNPWDFTSLSDIDFKYNIHGDSIASLPLTNDAGTSLGTLPVYFGTSNVGTSASGNVGDPFLFPLFWDGRGKLTQIDPARYRILTVEAGLPNLNRSLPGGSIGRIVWRALNEPTRGSDGLPGQTVAVPWIFNSKAGENMVAKNTVDMKDLPVETTGSIGQSGWTSVVAAGGIDAFRFDPHEFFNPTSFFVKRIKLAALERTVSDVLTFRWTYSKASGTVSLYRQAAGSAKNFSGGTLIVSASAIANSYAWNTNGVPDAEYQIYAIFTDGTNPNQVYAPTNVVVDHTNIEVATINLNRTQLNFATFGSIRTDPQIIRLTFTGLGSQCWTTSSTIAGMTISPSSGTGATAISISATGNFAGGTTSGIITIQSCTNSANSRAIAVSVTSLNTTSPPSGSMDTPADGSTASGSIAVTGWAIDDVQVVTVRICRDPVGDTTTPTLCGGQSKVYIGDAIFVDDARSDIEVVSPTAPLNYRAGWGYLMLTNFLPNQGNGPVTLYAYAIDREGNVSMIGSKSISTQNASATNPFGAIDTPGQGQAVCSTIINFGWALTQPGKDIPADSSTISVFVDNVFVGRPLPREARADITAAFPGYDTTHAVGGYFLDTTTLSNGVHTIFWIVTDNAGQTDGIGSRFFTVSNPCS